MAEIRQVAVIGAGTMGHGIAQVITIAGINTVLIDRDDSALNKAQSKIAAQLKKGVSLDKISESTADLVLTKFLKFSSELTDVADADLLIEAVPEDLALKKKLFASAESLTKESCILASNTSSLNIAEIAQDLRRPGQVIGLHFFNPVHIMKLLEIIFTQYTDDRVLNIARDFGQKIGKTAIVVKNSPGFATSRLGICYALEAMRMLEQGVASVEDIDAAMVLGYGHPMGPLKLTDLVGLDVRLAISNSLHEQLNNPAFTPPDILRRLVSEGNLGQKTGQGFYKWGQ